MLKEQLKTPTGLLNVENSASAPRGRLVGLHRSLCSKKATFVHIEHCSFEQRAQTRSIAFRLNTFVARLGQNFFIRHGKGVFDQKVYQLVELLTVATLASRHGFNPLRIAALILRLMSRRLLS